MTRQKHPNPLKDPEFAPRFARLLARYMIKLRISDDQLAHRMSKVEGAGSGNLATIRRHKDGTGGAPTYRTIGIYKDALGISDDDINRLLDPTHAASPGAPSFPEYNEQWTELVGYLRRQSQLPHHIQAERARAEAAVKEGDYDRARKHLMVVSEWTRDSYREHDLSLTHASEEYARALAGLGALAFTSMDFTEARVHYLKAFGLPHLPPERTSRYRHSYLVSSTALAGRSNSEAEARAILKEMTDHGITPNVVSYNTLLNFVKSGAEARAILKEMTDHGITPNVVSYSILLNFVNSEADARAILKEMTDHGITPDVVSYSTLLNFVNSEADARAILQEMTVNGVTPNVVSYSTLLNFVNSEADARAILKEMTDHGITPNVVSYNTLLKFVNSEADARAILQEMTDHGVTPNVVSYSTLLNFVKSEADARAILKEMTEHDVIPNEITATTAIKTAETFEAALGLIDFFLDKNFFARRGAFQAAYSKPITHLSAQELLTEYHSRKYKFETALESPINQYRRAGLEDQAVLLAMVAPHVGAAQKFYRERYALCRSFFEAALAAGNDEDNVHYAFGIAAALNGDWNNAKPNLKVALERSHAQKRTDYIKSLLSEAP